MKSVMETFAIQPPLIQKTFIGKIINRIVIRKKQNRVELVFNSDRNHSLLFKGVTILEDTVLTENQNGGATSFNSVPNLPQLQLVVNTQFSLVPLFKDKAFLTQKYVEEGLSIAQIAEEISSSKSTIRDNLIGFNVQLREHGQHHGNPSQPRFGKRKVKEELITHQAEQRVIRAAKEMRSDGASLRQIARYLDAMKVPTKCRGKSWHPEMVKRILDDQT